jgi:histidine ammonia-lyase
VKYGINTGFGLFSDVVIKPDQVSLLQTNLIVSHSAGVGEPLTIPRARMLMTIRINVLAKGRSGIRPSTLRQYLNALNANCIPFVPEKVSIFYSSRYMWSIFPH